MKTFLAAAVCFFVIIASLFVYVHFIDKTADDLLSGLDSLEKEVSGQNWEKTEQEFLAFREKWDKNRGMLGIFMDQSETEKISENISVLRTYIKSRNKIEALAKINAIKSLVEEISRSEKPTLVNILKLG